ncbi:hypothetical protein ACF2JD_05565 [Aeromonas sp. A-5]
MLQMLRQLVVAHLAAWLQGEAERGARFEQGRQLLQQGDRVAASLSSGRA